jgi:hypothetical protein
LEIVLFPNLGLLCFQEKFLELLFLEIYWTGVFLFQTLTESDAFFEQVAEYCHIFVLADL